MQGTMADASTIAQALVAGVKDKLGSVENGEAAVVITESGFTTRRAIRRYARRRKATVNPGSGEIQ